MVASLPEKIQAVNSGADLQEFVFPDPNRDPSVSTLLPSKWKAMDEAILDGLTCTPVQTVFDALPLFTDDGGVVRAALRKRFWCEQTEPAFHTGTIPQWVHYLTQNHEQRFWRVLENECLSSQFEQAKSLLQLRIAFHIESTSYPQHFGSKLYALFCPLPPYLLRADSVFPLVKMPVLIEMSRHAAEADSEDLQPLIDAVSGRLPGKELESQSESDSSSLAFPVPVQEKLNWILNSICQETLTRKFGIPIDQARGCFTLDRVTVDSPQQFQDIVTSFYLHLLRHTHTVTGNPVPGSLAPEAMQLVEKAFQNRGGLDAALAEAQSAITGGMRFILDL